MTDPLQQEADALEAEEKQATPGPWRVHRSAFDYRTHFDIQAPASADGLLHVVADCYEQGDNAAFIVALRNRAMPLIRALVERVWNLEQGNKAWQRDFEKLSVRVESGPLPNTLNKADQRASASTTHSEIPGSHSPKIEKQLQARIEALEAERGRLEKLLVRVDEWINAPIVQSFLTFPLTHGFTVPGEFTAKAKQMWDDIRDAARVAERRKSG